MNFHINSHLFAGEVQSVHLGTYIHICFRRVGLVVHPPQCSQLVPSALVLFHFVSPFCFTFVALSFFSSVLPSLFLLWPTSAGLAHWPNSDCRGHCCCVCERCERTTTLAALTVRHFCVRTTTCRDRNLPPGCRGRWLGLTCESNEHPTSAYT